MISSLDITKSAVVVLFRLAQDGPMCPDEIMKTASLAPRTVTHALRQLLDKKLCVKIPNLNDMRKPLYYVDTDKAKELEMELKRMQIQIRSIITCLK
jgi:DNA-binding MarR family transcriptional regulator